MKLVIRPDLEVLSTLCTCWPCVKAYDSYPEIRVRSGRLIYWLRIDYMITQDLPMTILKPGRSLARGQVRDSQAALSWEPSCAQQ